MADGIAIFDCPECERCGAVFTQEELDEGKCAGCGLLVCDEGDAINPDQINNFYEEVDFNE